MTAPQVKWDEIGYQINIIDGEPDANTWAAEFGSGFLVVRASPTGNESMVYVPHVVSGLGPQSDKAKTIADVIRQGTLCEVAGKLDITAQECLVADDPTTYEDHEHWINARNVVLMMLDGPQSNDKAEFGERLEIDWEQPS